jgi:hypothetical protein
MPLRVVGVVAAFVVWTTTASLHEPPQWDFGFYHLPWVRWAQAYPVVPGLANLLWPLGHTSAFFTLTAAFDARPFTWVQSYHIMGGVFVLALAGEGCVALLSLERSRLIPSEIVRAFGMVFSATLIGNWLPTLSPDVAVAVVGYCCASRLAVLTIDQAAEVAPENMRTLLALAGLGATLKVTAGFYFGAVAVVAMAAAPATLRAPRVMAPVLAAIGVFVASSLATSIILSGYPLYPAPQFRLGTSWMVPAATVRANMLATLWHTRRGDSTPAPHWIVGWLRNMVWTAGKFQLLLPLAIAGLAIVWTLARGHLRITRRSALFLVPAIGGCVLWVLSAPEPRFAGAMFWHVGIGILALAAVDWLAIRPATGRAIVWFAAPALIGLYLLAGSRSRDLRSPWSAAYTAPVPPIREVRTRSGLMVYVPSDDQRCLDAPLPCTPEPNPALALRGPALSSGFRVTTPER